MSAAWSPVDLTNLNQWNSVELRPTERELSQLSCVGQK